MYAQAGGAGAGAGGRPARRRERRTADIVTNGVVTNGVVRIGCCLVRLIPYRAGWSGDLRVKFFDQNLQCFGSYCEGTVEF